MQEFERALQNLFHQQQRLLLRNRITSVQDADRIIVMNDGRIDGIGTHEELLATNEIYRDVYESQQAGAGDFDEGGAN